MPGTSLPALSAGELLSLAEMITGIVDRAQRAPKDDEALLDLARTTARAEELCSQIGAGMAAVRR